MSWLCCSRATEFDLAGKESKLHGGDSGNGSCKDCLDKEESVRLLVGHCSAMSMSGFDEPPPFSESGIRNLLKKPATKGLLTVLVVKIFDWLSTLFDCDKLWSVPLPPSTVLELELLTFEFVLVSLRSWLSVIN